MFEVRKSIGITNDAKKRFDTARLIESQKKGRIISCTHFLDQLLKQWEEEQDGATP